MASPGTSWSEDEKRKLMAYYETRGPKWLGWAEILPGRSEDSIRVMASKLREEYELDTANSSGQNRRYRKWQEHEQAMLLKMMLRLSRDVGHDVPDISRELKRLVNLTNTGYDVETLKRKKTSWSVREDVLLLKVALKASKLTGHSVYECASQLVRLVKMAKEVRDGPVAGA